MYNNEMPIESTICIIRNEHEPTVTFGNFSCIKVIEEAQSGRWGNNCRIEEVYTFGNDFPYALRLVALYSKHKGFQIIEEDENFDSYLNDIKVARPHSPAIETLKAFIS